MTTALASHVAYACSVYPAVCTRALIPPTESATTHPIFPQDTCTNAEIVLLVIIIAMMVLAEMYVCAVRACAARYAADIALYAADSALCAADARAARAAERKKIAASVDARVRSAAEKVDARRAEIARRAEHAALWSEQRRVWEADTRRRSAARIEDTLRAAEDADRVAETETEAAAESAKSETEQAEIRSMRTCVLFFVEEERAAKAREMDDALARLFEDYTAAYWANPPIGEHTNRVGQTTADKITAISDFVGLPESSIYSKFRLSEAAARELFPESAYYARQKNMARGLPGTADLARQDKINIMKRVVQRICTITRRPDNACGPFSVDGVCSGGALGSPYSRGSANANIWDAAPVVRGTKIYIELTYGNFDTAHIDPTTAAQYCHQHLIYSGVCMVPVSLPAP